jgi:Holliday junction DNA helicase RuvB
MQIGFIERTPRGRVLTELGYRHLGLAYPESLQNRLL